MGWTRVQEGIANSTENVFLSVPAARCGHVTKFRPKRWTLRCHVGLPERLLPSLSLLLLGTPRSDSTPDPKGEALAGMVSENLEGTWPLMTTEHLHETRLPASQCCPGDKHRFLARISSHLPALPLPPDLTLTHMLGHKEGVSPLGSKFILLPQVAHL